MGCMAGKNLSKVLDFDEVDKNNFARKLTDKDKKNIRRVWEEFDKSLSRGECLYRTLFEKNPELVNVFTAVFLHHVSASLYRG